MLTVSEIFLPFAKTGLGYSFLIPAVRSSVRKRGRFYWLLLTPSFRSRGRYPSWTLSDSCEYRIASVFCCYVRISSWISTVFRRLRLRKVLPHRPLRTVQKVYYLNSRFRVSRLPGFGPEMSAAFWNFPMVGRFTSSPLSIVSPSTLNILPGVCSLPAHTRTCCVDLWAVPRGSIIQRTAGLPICSLPPFTLCLPSLLP